MSVINTVVTLSGGDFHLVYGLGITDLVNALAQRAGFGGIILDVVINGIAIGSFVLFWRFARQGHRWAFLVGMTFYLLDALILLPLKGSLLNIAFHAYALYGLFAGYQATNLLAKLNATGVNSDV